MGQQTPPSVESFLPRSPSEFDAAHDELLEIEVTEAQQTAVAKHYRDIFLPRLAAYTDEQIDRALNIMGEVGRELGLID